MPYKDITAADIFQCRMCGECCRGYGGTYLTESDITAISAHLGLEASVFLQTCCTYSGSRPILAQKADGFCVFWENRLCRIHPVKPRMCKAWPFIESVLTDIGNWEIMSAFCPGIKTEFPPDVILACVRKEVEKIRDRHL